MKTPVLESFLIQLQILRTATLLKRDSCTAVKFLRTPYFTELIEHLQWLLLKVSGFKPATLLKKEFRQRCFSLNFAKFLRTFFDRTLPNDWFLSLSVNFEKFFRTSLYRAPLRNCLFHLQVAVFQPADTLKNYCYSQVLFKHFIQEREVAIRRRSFT